MDRFTSAIVGGVIALVLAALAVAALARGREAPPDLTTPAGVVLAYALAESRGDGQTAWELLAGSAQTRSDRERFIAHVGSPRPQSGYLATEEERIDGDTASVTLVHTFSGSGSIFGNGSSTIRNLVRLAREPAGWRITVPPDDYALSLPRF